MLDLLEARPVLRVALGIVTPQPAFRQIASGAAMEMDTLGGPHALLGALASTRSPLGDLPLRARAGLIMTLDELAELEALEAAYLAALQSATEWRFYPGQLAIGYTATGGDQATLFFDPVESADSGSTSE